jgi:acetyl-CoA decarbonylase/synthase complex subunit gamma
LITVGSGDAQVQIGNETVMFRHEEKFHRPCAVGFLIDDDAPDDQIRQTVAKINALQFERVGQKLAVNVVAVRQKIDALRFAKVVGLIAGLTPLGLVLMSSDLTALRAALEIVKGKNPLVYKANPENKQGIAQLAKDYKVPVVVAADDFEQVAALTQELNLGGVRDIMIEVAGKSLPENILSLTQIRRQALKRSNRALGYPAFIVVSQDDPYEQAIVAATYIAKYAGMVIIKGVEAWQALSILTLRQNIYSDPQKPLQIEPKLYPIGAVTKFSPVLVTTYFSLSYFTVLGEVEASKVPAYILSVDTEGMSVLTAWAAEKFTPERIALAMNKFDLAATVAHKRLIIPGYVAVLSGDLQEQSGWEIVVGPKEAAGLPAFLRNRPS